MAYFLTSIAGDRRLAGQPPMEIIGIDVICSVEALISTPLAITAPFFIPASAYLAASKYDIGARQVRFYHVLKSKNNLTFRIGRNELSDISTSRYEDKVIKVIPGLPASYLVEQYKSKGRDFIFSKLMQYRYFKASVSDSSFLYARSSCVEFFDDQNLLSFSGSFELPTVFLASFRECGNGLDWTALDCEHLTLAASMSMIPVRYVLGFYLDGKPSYLQFQLEEDLINQDLQRLEIF